MGIFDELKDMKFGEAYGELSSVLFEQSTTFLKHQKDILSETLVDGSQKEGEHQDQ